MTYWRMVQRRGIFDNIMTPRWSNGSQGMRLDVFAALSIGSTLALAGAALGQQPAPSPASPAPPADYGPPITNEQAKAAAGAALAEEPYAHGCRHRRTIRRPRLLVENGRHPARDHRACPGPCT